jgi:GNAT superfamily N-acetyltransferase
MNPINIRNYSSSDWPGVAELITAWEFKPFSGYAFWPPGLLEDYCLRTLAKSLASPPSLALVAESDDSFVGLVILNMLPWDSDQLGCPVGRLDYLLAEGTYWEQFAIKMKLMEMVHQYRAEKVLSFLNARVHASDLTSLHVLEQAGFITVDGILTFLIDVNDRLISHPQDTENIKIRLATLADRDILVEMARATFLYDRFHSDPFIALDVADELHGVWLENSVNGTAADAVILAENDTGPLGFVTCKLQHSTKSGLGKLLGTIVLVGTAKEARGKGVARQMSSFALAWFKQQGVDMVEVGTQLRNIPAARLYQRCGFRLVNSSISLSKFYPQDVSKRI